MVGKKKSFVYQFIWVSILLMVMGGIFLTVAIILQVIPMQPEDVTSYRNGIRQTSTEETLRTFRLVFLLGFGLPGAGLFLGGIGSLFFKLSRKGRNQELKDNGVHIKAYVTEFAPSAVRVNNRPVMRLRCSYAASNGHTYIFKSPMLRMDPTPYLSDGKVDVYYDRDNMKRYFVDIDGSTEIGTTIIEL